MRIVIRRRHFAADNDNIVEMPIKVTKAESAGGSAHAMRSAGLQSVCEAVRQSQEAFIEKELLRLGEDILFEPVPERLLERLKRCSGI